jgi:Streptomyces sporulation and cell division protein, SsgA
VIRVAPDGTLTLGTTAQVLAEPLLVQHDVELRYTPDEPFAVGLNFRPEGAAAGRSGSGGVLWRLDRDVLGAGHPADHPCGDVRVTRLEALAVVVIELMPGTDAATIVRFEADGVDEFLRATYRMVPHGAESLDVDGLIRRILETA